MATEAPSRGSARVPCVEPEKVAHPFGNSWYVSSAVSTPIFAIARGGYVIYYVVYRNFDLRSHRNGPRFVSACLQSGYSYGGYDTYYDDDEY